MKIDIISADIPPEKRTQRGTYKATLLVGNARAEFDGVYELTSTALVMETIDAYLKAKVASHISLSPANE